VVRPVTVAPLKPTPPVKVFAPLMVCAVSRVEYLPGPPIATMDVALPPAPPVPTPMNSVELFSENASSALARVVGVAVAVLRLMRIVLDTVLPNLRLP
jgi:hypothetical protein